MNKKIILCGKAASGKDYFRDYLVKEKGKIPDISYTTRPPRKGEINGVTYHFVTQTEFDNNEYYEKVLFNGWSYGTKLKSWQESDVLIMTPSGINHITAKDRENCIVVYFDIDEKIRKERLLKRSDADSVDRRLESDEADFKDFKDYNVRVVSPFFDCESVFNIVYPRINYIDIDGVIADFNQHFLEYLGFEDTSPAKAWDDPRFKNNFQKIAYVDDFWLNIPTIESNASFLRENPDIIHGYCTARTCDTETTREWLLKNNLPDLPIITVGFDGIKSDYLKEVGCTNFIDDAIHNYEDVNKAGINCYLMTRPHNKRLKTNKRVNTLKQWIKEISS